MRSVELTGTWILNLPLALVTVPIDVPSTLIEAPGIGCWSSLAMTVPVIVLFCAFAIEQQNKSTEKRSNTFFIIRLA
ncbi:hypothetical protein D3C85_1704390 [compost metagenome]